MNNGINGNNDINDTNDISAPANNKQSAAIVFEHVSKTFPGTAAPAVNDISLDVAPGSFVVLLGPSGCGKTTLLKMVNRLYEHDSGRILLEGQEIRSFKITELRRRIGYVIQSTGLFPHMTVAKNIATVPDMLHWSKERIAERTDELLDLVGMDPKTYKPRYPAQLSGGQQQRVGLARAMAADPDIMLMDEPFAAIDNITRRHLQDELLMIQSKVHKTILFVTHDVEEALKLADKMAVMQLGKVLQYDTPLNILSNPVNNFVAELVGAGDVLRRLSLLEVQLVMEPLEPGQTPPEGASEAASVECTSSLRDALSVMLANNANVLPVKDGDGKQVGTLSLADIRTAIRNPRSGQTGVGRAGTGGTNGIATLAAPPAVSGRK
jgi:osmoprotectant transport system ATP-binding protein